MDSFLRDLTYAVRALRQDPAFGAIAVGVLALGIGANTGVFSVVNAVLLKPLPYADADSLVQFEISYAGVRTATAGPQAFHIWRRRTTVFQDVSAYWLDHMNLTGGPNPELVPVGLASADFFRLFGAPVASGRTFRPEEDRPGGGHVAVLSMELWKRRFGGDSRAVGRTILLSGVPYTVIGILGPFDTEQFDQAPDVWIPFQIDPAGTQKDSRLCFVAGRLKPGVTLEQGKAELAVITGNERRTAPKSLRERDAYTVERLRDALVGDVRRSLLLMAGAVSLVLLIACSDIANLLLARAAARRREIAIRTALGAGRARILRQLLTEALLLSAAGAAIELGVGWGGMRWLLGLYPATPYGGSSAAVNMATLPRIGEHGNAVTLDARVLLFTVVVSVLASLLSGILPAVRVSRAHPHSALQQAGGRAGTGSRQRWEEASLVVTETALAILLLIGAGLLIRTTIALRTVNPGFDVHNILTMQMSLAGPRLAPPAAVDRVVEDAKRGIEALPGVENVAAACCLPLETTWQMPYIVVGRPLNGRFHGFAGWTFASPEYFQLLQIPLLRGRGFTDEDNRGAPGVAIINETFARLAWPNSDPLRDRVLVGRTMGPEYENDPIRQIVGVVGDVRDLGLSRKPRPILYVPIAQVPDSVKAAVLPLLPVAWLVRTRGAPEPLGRRISEALRSASGGLPVTRVRSMEQVAAQSTARAQFNTALMICFGCVGLLLAAAGLSGLMAYSVRQRMPEIGIRLALGAQPREVRRMMLAHGARLIAAGIALGIPAAFGLTKLIARLLFGVTPRDPLAFIAAPVVLAAVGLLAVWVPARRAARIDPVQALRSE